MSNLRLEIQLKCFSSSAQFQGFKITLLLTVSSVTKSSNILKKIQFKYILALTNCNCCSWLYDLFNVDHVNVICLQWMKAAQNNAADKQKERLFFIYLWHTVCLYLVRVSLCMCVLQGADSH